MLAMAHTTDSLPLACGNMINAKNAIAAEESPEHSATRTYGFGAWFLDSGFIRNVWFAVYPDTKKNVNINKATS